MTYLFLKPQQFDSLRENIGVIPVEQKILGSVYTVLLLGSYFRGVIEHMIMVARVPE